jgi:hypothetical protein
MSSSLDEYCSFLAAGVGAILESLLKADSKKQLLSVKWR